MKTIKIFLSGVAVYLSVASIHACGGTDVLPPWAATGTTGETTGSGGAPASSASAGGHGGKGGSVMNPIDEALAESGSRLKVQWMNGDDGSKFVAGVIDSTRNEACSFFKMTDGSTRCIPFNAASGNYAGYFADPACTMRISGRQKPPCATEPTYAYTYVYSVPGDVCSATGVIIFQIGSMITPATIYSMSGTTCVSSQPNANQEYRLVGPEIPPSAFVAASVTTDP